MVSEKSSENPRPRAKEKACDRAIKRTLAYSSVFNYPVSIYQLYTFLITRKNYEYDFFHKSLRRLVKSKKIKAKNGKYYLPGMRPVSWKLRSKYSKDLMKETVLGVNLLKNIPWIKMITVTGAVAARNAAKDDDIDIMIVTEKNRVWLTRFFTYFILKIIGKYGHGKRDKRKFCCNLFVDESAMKWGKAKQNIYIAREFLSMHPLYDRDNTYLKCLDENSWALKHFYNYKIEFPKKHVGRFLNKSKIVDGIENLVRKAQLNYMKSKKTTEITTKHLIHFNKNDHTSGILSEYKERLSGI